MLEADGTALGILPWSMSEDHSIVLDTGDLLIVASDGFPEAQNIAGEMFGYEALMRLIETHRAESAETTLLQREQAQLLHTAIAISNGDHRNGHTHLAIGTVVVSPISQPDNKPIGP